MRKTIYAEGEIYHIYNRGTDRREIFLSDYDRFRFIQDLEFMNSTEPVLNAGYSFVKNFPVHIDSNILTSASCAKKPGMRLVDIHSFVLMPNHYHLLLTQRVAGGISSFMHKMGTAYAMYFNRRYKRDGVLFQGAFKSVMIKEESHFDGIPFYIHSNPLKLAPKLKSVELEMAFLKSYKWSSFNDYAGIQSFPSLLTKATMEEFFAENGGFSACMIKYLENRKKSPIEASPQ